MSTVADTQVLRTLVDVNSVPHLPRPPQILRDDAVERDQESILSADPSELPVVFISYAWSDFDVVVAEKLFTYLKFLPDVEIFYDKRALQSGDLITTKVADALRRTVVAITILSVDYFDPDRYTARVELPAIIDGEAADRLTVIPLISRPLPLDQFTFFEDRLAANRLDEPLSSFGVGHHRFDQTLVEVFNRVREIVQHLTGSSHRIEETTTTAGGSGSSLESSPEGAVGVVHGAPPLPLRYFYREELVEIRQRLFRNDVFGLTGKEDVYGISGDGGIGKTVLASAIAWDDEIAGQFPGGIYWLTVGENTRALSVQTEFCRALGTTVDFQNSLEGRATVQNLLADRQILVILDDVWSAAQLADLVMTGPRGRTLVTTRSESRVLKPLDVPSFNVSSLRPPRVGVL
jgi:hypothetical protein